jgi:hypothetical protein
MEDRHLLRLLKNSGGGGERWMPFIVFAEAEGNIIVVEICGSDIFAGVNIGLKRSDRVA